MGGVRIPASWPVPGGKATGLTKRSPLKGLVMPRPAGCQTGSAEVWEMGAPSVGFFLCSPATLAPGTHRGVETFSRPNSDSVDSRASRPRRDGGGAAACLASGQTTVPQGRERPWLGQGDGLRAGGEGEGTETRSGRICVLPLAPREGFEPSTLRLTAACSTVELSGNVDSLLCRPGV